MQTTQETLDELRRRTARDIGIGVDPASIASMIEWKLREAKKFDYSGPENEGWRNLHAAYAAHLADFAS